MLETINAMFAPGKGLLAADESSATADKRFDSVGIEKTVENRRLYRQLLFTAPATEQFVSGIILYDETFWQKTDQGELFVDYLARKGIMPGIKVDMGLTDLPGFPNEQVTEGLDGLLRRMANYSHMGARFAKWRAAIKIGDDIPTDECIGANTYTLARYARICQEANIVPIVEPEILFDGSHSIERCEEVMRHTFDILFHTMRAFKVDMQCAVLKTSMVLPGKEIGEDNIDADQVAGRTSAVLVENVPNDLGGTVFLSGGQTPKQAMVHLNRIEQKGTYPWGLTFSYSRALQDPVLKYWGENMDDVMGAQAIFGTKLKQASQASLGQLDEADLDKDDFVTESQN